MFRKTCALVLSTLVLVSLFSRGSFAEAVKVQSESEMFVTEEQEQEGVQKEEQEEDFAFQKEKIVDGILISVKADAGVFPNDAKLRVKRLKSYTDKKKVESKIEEKLEEGAELMNSHIFDISILNSEGEEQQPENEKGDVKVSFERLNILEKGKELAVFHLDETDAEAEKLAEVEVKEEEKSVELKAEHFSLFVVSLIV